MVPSDGGSVATAVSTAAADKLLHGPVSGKKIQKKATRKVHKAEWEKLKHDHLNDLLNELDDMLDEDGQNYGKACILANTTRILRDMLSQVESLRKENSTLQNESHYITMERDELQDETSALGKEILELQSELRIRLSGNSGWGLGASKSDSASAVRPWEHPATIASTIIHLQQPLPLPTLIEELPCAEAPRELKLFPKAGAGYEPAEEQEAPNHITRPEARYPMQAASWPVSLFSGLPTMEDEQCSNTTTGSKETSTGRLSGSVPGTKGSV